MKVYAGLIMMVTVEPQETNENKIKEQFADSVSNALDNSAITDYEYIDVLEVRKAVEQK